MTSINAGPVGVRSTNAFKKDTNLIPGTKDDDHVDSGKGRTN